MDTLHVYFYITQEYFLIKKRKISDIYFFFKKNYVKTKLLININKHLPTKIDIYIKRS